MRVFVGLKELLTLAPAAGKFGRKVKEEDLGIIPQAAIVEEKGRVAWIGPEAQLPQEFAKAERIDLGGRTVLPGFVECHTHSIFAGDRVREFEWRNQGMSYQQIAEQGGGIKSTMAATREASSNQLLEIAQKRVQRFVAQGVTTLEIKSGYGLSLEAELKILEVAGKLKGPAIVRTFLGPHARPPEFKRNADYLHEIRQKWLSKVAELKLAERADIFVENGYFTIDETQSYFAACRELGLELTGHMDQMSRTGACRLGVDLNLASVDHCVHASDEDIQALAASSTVAVLLPTADFYLKIPFPPARKMIDQGCTVALATDFNPGTSPTQDLSFVGVLARLEMKMSLPEVIAAYTVGAAQALSRLSQEGSLQNKKLCNFICLDASWRDIFYSIGQHPVKEVWREGQRLQTNP